MTKINGNYPFPEDFKPEKKSGGAFKLPPLFQSPKTNSQDRLVDEKQAIDILKKDGYKLTPQDDGTYIIEDILGHKSKITDIRFNERGGVTFNSLMVEIIDPSQRERYKKNVINGGEDSPEEKAMYAKQAMDKVQKAGYKIEDQGDGTYLLTNPEGFKSLVEDFDIGYDGGAIWSVLPVYLNSEKSETAFKPL